MTISVWLYVSENVYPSYPNRKDDRLIDANKPPSEWIGPDDAPEWTDEMIAMAEYSVGGVVIRPATGVLTRDGMRPIGRPPLGPKARRPVAMRLPPHVLAWFRATGPGWQRRVADVLEGYVAKDVTPRTD